MVYNTYIKCQVCGSITRIRLQVGRQEKHPIVVTCGKCGTSLSGIVIIDQEKHDLIFKFENADETDVDNADYLLECSGEFPTSKQRSISDDNDFLLSPFIRYSMLMKSNDSYEMFGKALSSLDATSKKWTDYKRIINLFKNKSEYTIQEIQKQFSGYYYQCRDDSEVLRAVHLIEVRGFYSALKKDIINNHSFYEGILKLDTIQLKQFIEFLNNYDGFHLEELQELIYKIYDEFIEVYQKLIPALSIQYCKDGAFDYEQEGTTTSSFNDVKQFYLDIYEALGNLLIIPVVLNNIKHRSDFNIMHPIESKVTSLEDYIRLPKASKFHYCIRSEIYTDALDILVNSKLRNAIGHNDIEYDTINQIITFIPNPQDRTKKKTEFLLEFENEAIHMFQSVLVISEYLYRLREISLIFDGKRPITTDEIVLWRKRIGRNDSCPCGSGMKFKFCHGRNR